MPRACKQGNTNEKLRDLITEPIVKEGFVYVLRAPQYSAKHFPDEIPLVKIGKAMKPGTRITQIRKTCGIDDLERVLDTQNSRCRYYYKIEKLVHAELSSYQRTLKCDCKNNAHHREWFAVPESVALQAVQRWRRFMKQDPYDDRGILRDVWSEMTDWENFQQESGDEHESRHRYWTAWLDEGISRVAATKAVAFNGGT
ncbi:T5orf172 domain-containing protein [Cadophora sp. MPI-SDFR-AT-0126]|nr:T5orf172 domain-containing protein [Leotiomycetes sp. MPI-SDFR-AT-0126]